MLLLFILPLVVEAAVLLKEDEMTTVEAIPIRREMSTTVGWVPIEDVPGSDSPLSSLPTPTTATTSTTTTTVTTTTRIASYSTTSFEDAQIQYVPYRLEDIPMPVIDIELPYANRSHVVTWLDPAKMIPIRTKLKPSIYNIRPAPLYPIVQKREIFESENPNVTIKEYDRVHHHHHHHHRVKRGVDQWAAINSQNQHCGGEFTELFGIVRSPGYPLYYPNKKECHYQISLPSNFTIKFACDDFSLQGKNGNDCENDYIKLKENGTVIGRYCGAQSPTVSSTSNELMVIFKSDDRFRYKGFKCRYRAIQPNGNAVIGSFGDEDEDSGANNNVVYSSNFFTSQVGQCLEQSGINVDQLDPTNGGGNSEDDSNIVGVNTHGFGGLWSGVCGTANSVGNNQQNRIVGGFETMEHQYPWMVSILRECGAEFCHICGGTIISPSWILTSAHCVSTVPIVEMGILLGDHNLYQLSYEQKFMRATNKIMHPDFNEPTILNNDIGLVRLESEVAFTKFINPLCLPALGETGFGTSAYGDGSSSTLDTTGLQIVGKNSTVIGWGMVNDDGMYPDGLHEVQVQVLANQVCSDLYGPMITENMMCTSGTDSRGSCYGDSGGPALVRGEDGSYVQVGIVSFGAVSACTDGYPSGQVLVHKYIDWIQHITGLEF